MGGGRVPTEPGCSPTTVGLLGGSEGVEVGFNQAGVEEGAGATIGVGSKGKWCWELGVRCRLEADQG